jgi:FkbM family methyltransferase
MYKRNFIFYIRALDWLLNKYIFRRTQFKRKLRDVEMYLDLVNPGISKVLSVYRTREDDMVQVIKEELKPGMTVVDCGSNIGFYPLLASKILNGSGKIFAIEPDERNFRILEQNATLHQSDVKIKTFKMALSNSTGMQKMFVAERANLNKLVSDGKDDFAERSKVNQTIDVDTMTMDDFCTKHKISVDFVRMDIEGFEVEVFEGMKNVFKNAKSGFKVFLELHPIAYSKERSFADELNKLIGLGFFAKVLITAGEALPEKVKLLGYSPKKLIPSDGVIRGYYDNIKNEDLITLTCTVPKVSRYVLLEKK